MSIICSVVQKDELVPQDKVVTVDLSRQVLERWPEGKRKRIDETSWLITVQSIDHHVPTDSLHVLQHEDPSLWTDGTRPCESD
jgi:hypothetical protein